MTFPKVLINDAGGDFQLSLLKETNRIVATCGRSEETELTGPA